MSKRPRCAATGKLRFPDWDTAAHAALVSSKKRGTALRVYTCEHCGSHHLTKRPANRVVATVPGPFTPADMARVAGRRQESA